ncbi:MAG: hypothetical protein M3115_03825 [Thermoproteota archaeon]|nr:hypothetical protein [Thermoproteota archaeon]
MLVNPSSNPNPNFERRLDEICEGLQPYIKRHLLEKISQENASMIIEYVYALRIETNLSLVYKEAIINTLTTLAKFHPRKSFKDMTRGNILSFLARLRKTEEQDCKHRWIGTYNQNIRHLARFYKWLYYPLVDPIQRPKPDQIQNIRPIHLKEDSNMLQALASFLVLLSDRIANALSKSVTIPVFVPSGTSRRFSLTRDDEAFGNCRLMCH